MKFCYPCGAVRATDTIERLAVLADPDSPTVVDVQCATCGAYLSRERVLRRAQAAA